MEENAGSSLPAQRTPLHDRHLAAGARMVPFAGFEMPIQYGGVLEEHRAVRTAAGLFDVSHMGELWIAGDDAQTFLQSLLPNDVAKLAPGRAHYNALLDTAGGMLDDLLVYRVGPSRFLLVVNAGHLDQDREWIAARAAEWPGVTLEDRSATTALLALQGPAAAAILAPITPVDLAALRYYGFAHGAVDGVECLVSRTGYTGEDGFELYLAAESAGPLWDRLLETGRAAGLVPAGLGARDTLRLEAGMLLAGQDFDRSTTPLEVGLDWVVKLDKGDFVGREALACQRAEGVRQRLVGFTLAERGIARHGHGVRLEVGGRACAGVVTSGTWSPTRERAIGLARISSDAALDRAPVGTPLRVEIRGREVAGEVAGLPFYRRPGTAR
ncbi:MAG TPA: glycine cleavage system aminomethyltransferase GcvT [Thermoanaerobaculia bacterium]|nr:glycine cleavage system aminomethyltransferase GcvT [Thermoanaerobaculia bacterium]